MLLFLACKKNDTENYQKKELDRYFFDVVGNHNIDTLIVENSKTIKFNKSISILLNGEKSLICELKPRLDSTFILTSPRIENIYLEANAVQTSNKGFRILSRNTDIKPEYFFMDLYFRKEWLIDEIGFLDVSSKKPVVCKKNIQKSVKSFSKYQINPKDINQIYFKGTYCK